jgi:hypothetical protein
MITHSVHLSSKTSLAARIDVRTAWIELTSLSAFCVASRQCRLSRDAAGWRVPIAVDRITKRAGYDHRARENETGTRSCRSLLHLDDAVSSWTSCLAFDQYFLMPADDVIRVYERPAFTSLNLTCSATLPCQRRPSLPPSSPDTMNIDIRSVFTLFHDLNIGLGCT